MFPPHTGWLGARLKTDFSADAFFEVATTMFGDKFFTHCEARGGQFGECLCSCAMGGLKLIDA